jgi:hypothetical protein
MDTSPLCRVFIAHAVPSLSRPVEDDSRSRWPRFVRRAGIAGDGRSFTQSLTCGAL